MLKEKELRFALVCYGGVSLAVYMHGVTKEILKLVRASKAYHGIPEVEARRQQSFAEANAESRHEHDSEAVYFELLKAIGERLDLRVIVDVVAGASAGGINGVTLARALAHDLSIEGLREIWLHEADVAELLAPERKAGPWSKWFLSPLIWVYSRIKLGPVKADAEMRQKLSMFLRSRWFRPPFSGRRLAATLLDGIGGMRRGGDGESSLLPLGQRLELFVTVTDFFGYLRRIPIHDPPVVREREHRHILRFEYCRWPNGDMVSDFDDDGVPALSFAARATSSFPGAFPPAQIAEMQSLLARRGHAWQQCDYFLDRNFHHYRSGGADPALTSFVDGSVLNNKPFAEAIQSIRDRPAFRQVDRRLVYIDPDPMGPPPPSTGQRPGFFRTLKGALSDIPRQEPIYDELTWIAGFNQRVRRASAMIEATRADVLTLVTELAPDAVSGPLSAERVGAWRETASVYAGRQAGFVHGGYLGLRRLATLLAIAEQFARGADLGPDSAEAEALGQALQHWGALAIGSGPSERRTGAAPAAADTLEFLRRFDLDFRRRRIRFVIRALNQLYGHLGGEAFAELTARDLDDIKMRLYARLDAMRLAGRMLAEQGQEAPEASRLLEPKLLAALTEAGGEVRTLVEAHRSTFDAAMQALAELLQLARTDDETDRLMAEISAIALPEAVRRELLAAYIGFAFWDVLTFPLANWRDLGEFDEIRVDRISPEDCATIRAGGAKAVLKGIEFGHFGAFFSRSHRENDYLWGRLHGAERLIDLVFDAARLEAAHEALDLKALKKRAFAVILEAERPHLKTCAGLIGELEDEVRAL